MSNTVSQIGVKTCLRCNQTKSVKKQFPFPESHICSSCDDELEDAWIVTEHYQTRRKELEEYSDFEIAQLYHLSMYNDPDGDEYTPDDYYEELSDRGLDYKSSIGLINKAQRYLKNRSQI